MKLTDVWCAQQVPNSHRTGSMYLPTQIRYEDMPKSILIRALCPKNMAKDWHVCQKCMSGCVPGNLLVAYETGAKDPPEVIVANAKPPAPIVVKPKEPPKKPMGRRKDTAKALAMVDAKRRIEAGEDHHAVAVEMGYKDWYTLRDGMIRRGVTPPTLPKNFGDRTKWQQYMQGRHDASMARMLETLRLIDSGMDKETAARQAGWSGWKVAEEYRRRHKDEVDRRAMA